jgi:hypothetical protein
VLLIHGPGPPRQKSPAMMPRAPRAPERNAARSFHRDWENVACYRRSFPSIRPGRLGPGRDDGRARLWPVGVTRSEENSRRCRRGNERPQHGEVRGVLETATSKSVAVDVAARVRVRALRQETGVERLRRGPENASPGG